jgi:hypothetical protein
MYSDTIETNENIQDVRKENNAGKGYQKYPQIQGMAGETV